MYEPLQRAARGYRIPKEYECSRCHGTLRLEVVVVSCYNCGYWYALDCDNRELVRLQVLVDIALSPAGRYSLAT